MRVGDATCRVAWALPRTKMLRVLTRARHTPCGFSSAALPCGCGDLVTCVMCTTRATRGVFEALSSWVVGGVVCVPAHLAGLWRGGLGLRGGGRPGGLGGGLSCVG
jgi:hypothetical protein